MVIIADHLWWDSAVLSPAGGSCASVSVTTVYLPSFESVGIGNHRGLLVVFQDAIWLIVDGSGQWLLEGVAQS